MTPYAAEIRAYTEGVLRARAEYRMHPLSYGHGEHCAALGCTVGRRYVAMWRKTA